MIGKQKHIIFLIIAFVILFASCTRVVVTVDSIPSNTPTGQPIFITGNFNNWDPGEEKYQMQLQSDSSYTVYLPPGFGSIEYKFTRGDWTTVEKDICGYETGNRTFLLGQADTVNNFIESWGDLDPINCPRITLLLTDIPPNTEVDDKIAVAGNFNSWSPNLGSILDRDSSGQYSITIERPPDITELEFKMTRGDLSSAESDEFGNMLPNRVVKFGVSDTVKINIDGWIDKRDKMGSNRVILIVRNLPLSTPLNDDLYFVSSLCNWTSSDKNYIFQMNRNGSYYFPIPRKRKTLEYKITRGDWMNVEVDKYGFEIENRSIDLVNEDTVYIDIGGWKDKTFMNDGEVTIVLSALPETTPENTDFYITGNLNGWSQRSKKHKFDIDQNGDYSLNIRRDRGILEFKVLRGSWNTIEVDQFGSDIPNRFYHYKDVDSIFVEVANWKDKPTSAIDDVTIVINSFPRHSPQLEEIYLAPNFNDWNPGDRNLIFSKLKDDRFYITVPKKGDDMEYKITRGSWETVEVDENGNQMPDRRLTFGFADTVYIDLVKWRDFGGNY